MHHINVSLVWTGLPLPETPNSVAILSIPAGSRLGESPCSNWSQRIERIIKFAVETPETLSIPGLLVIVQLILESTKRTLQTSECRPVQLEMSGSSG